VASPQFQNLGERYGDLIQEAIEQQGLELDDVCFVTAEEDPSVPPQRKDGGFGPVPRMRPRLRHSRNARLSRRASTGLPRRQLNQRYTFRRLRYRQRQPVCSAPPRWRWPSGPRRPTIRCFCMAVWGMGKTHLMHAMATR